MSWLFFINIRLQTIVSRINSKHNNNLNNNHMKKILFYTLAACSVVMYSCSDDEGGEKANEELTVAEAKVAMQQTSSDATTDIVNMTKTEGIEGLRNFFDLIGDTDPFGGRKDVSHEEYRGFIKKQTRLFRELFAINKSINGKGEGDDFNFNENKGIYNWDSQLEKFVKSQEESNIIKLNFPTEGSQTNNASLSMTEYMEIIILDGDYEEYYPTRLAANLTIDDMLVIDVDATVSYNDYGDPVSGDLSVELVPYTFSLVFDDTQSTTASLVASISENNTAIVGVDIVITFDSAEKEEVNSIAGNVVYGDMRIEGDITIPEDESEDEDLNDFVNLELFQDGSKLGDIIFKMETNIDGDTDDIPYVQYSDGTTDRLEDIFENTVMEVEDFLDDLDEWG